MVSSWFRRENRGLTEWLIQRFSALIIGLGVVWLAMGWYFLPANDYQHWHSLFQPLWVRVFASFVVLSTLWHAWIGLWTVFTDYIKCSVARVLLQGMTLVLLGVYFLWGMRIFWFLV